MAYTKTNWQNLPSTQTPINATNLNHIETGIKDNETLINGIASDLTNYTNGTTTMGNIVVGGVVTSRNTSDVATQSLTDSLTIKVADNTTAPGNGLVLEYSKYDGFGGQLYIGDNSGAGIYFNGWTNGTKGTWKRVQFEEDSGWQDLTLLNGVTARSQDAAYKPQYRKIGKIVYLKGQVTIPSHGGDLQMAELPVGYRPSYEAKMPSLGVGGWIDTLGGIILQASGDLQYQSINTSWVVD